MCSASPVFPANGDYIVEAVDLGLPTPGLPLVASRTYQASHFVDGPVGFGWTSSLSVRLSIATYLFTPPSTYKKAAFVTMPNGRRFRYSENSDGVTYTAPTGRYDVLVKNGDGTYNLTLQRSRTKYHFSSTGNLLSMTDDYGNVLNMTYDGSGRPKRLTDAAGSGRYLDITYGANGRISLIADNSGRHVQYSYDTATGALTSFIDAAGRTFTIGYQALASGPFLSTVTDQFGRGGGCASAGGSGCCGTSASCVGGEVFNYAYTYNGNSNQTAKTDQFGHSWVFTTNPAGQITDDMAPDGYTYHRDYYPDGSIQQTIDQVGVRTYYSYNAQGSVLSVTKDYTGPTAVRFDYVYDTSFPTKAVSITPKNPTSGVVDPHWQAWKYDYYPAGSAAPGALFHVYRVRDDGTTLDTLATYEYNSHGQVTKSTSAIGGVTDYTYDATGNLWKVTGPANNDAGSRPLTTYGYDSAGRVLNLTDPLNHQASYTYDGVNRILTVTLPKPVVGSPLNFVTTYSYDHFDAASQLTYTHITDPNGKLTKQGYDAFNRLAQTVDAAGNVTDYGYTGALLASITDANDNVTSYAYDAKRNLQTVTFPNGDTESYIYTKDNLLDRRTDRKGQMVNFDYDNFKRLSIKWYPTGDAITYTYVGQKLTQITDGSVSPGDTHFFSYDSSYRLASNTQAGRGTINYLYNADDTVQNYSVQSGPSATYTYYPDGSLNTIAWSPVAGTFKYRYTLPGQYQSVTFPNNATRNYAYDDQGRLTNLTNLASGAVNRATYAYSYDFNWTTGQSTMLGQRTSMTATVPSQSLSGSVFKYEYDALYELTKVTYPNVAPLSAEIDSWTYDRIGNRLTQTVNGVTTNYTYQKIGANPLNWQRLLTDGTNAYTYDDNGNTLSKAGSTFTWNFDDRMTGITGTSSYAYDYRGRRSSKSVGTTSTYFYDGLNLIREAGVTPADYLFGSGIDEPLAMSRGGSTYYYGVDGLGSATLVTNSSFVVQNSYLYDAWGTTRSSTAPVSNPLTYTAREIGEVGTLFYRARFYSPAIGRFFAEDDPRQQSGPNKYTYVDSSPATYGDPTGLAILRCWRPLRQPLTYMRHYLPFLDIPVPGNNWCPRHEYVYNTTTGLSKGFDPKENRAETGKDKCREIPDPVGTCVWDSFWDVAGPMADYNFLTNNCHNAVNSAAQRCKEMWDCSTPIVPVGIPAGFNDKR